MSIRWRLALLILFVTVIPVATGVLVTRQLVGEILDVGLSPQLDSALDAGVRQAREAYRADRRELQAQAEELAHMWTMDEDGRAILVQAIETVLKPEDQVIIIADDGTREVLQIGAVLDNDAVRAPDAPPRSIAAKVDLEDGLALEVTRPVPDSWRDDAALTAETLQVVRGLRMQRSELERMYWLPFLGLFLLSLVVGLVLALRLVKGITGPVNRLVDGTEDVAAGRWNVQVPVERQDELGQLTVGFNTMVRTLNLQSRRLVDLEKMAGWREMARALAHEVKNPLTPIQLTVEEIRARYPGGDEKYEALLKECTRIVIEEVESLRSVVARFREFSQPVALEPVPTDIAQLVRDVAAMQRDMKVEVETADNLEPIPADPDRLRQILMNLAVNAREATTLCQESRLGLTVKGDDDWVVVTVEDNGPGIAPNERERIFEPYRSGKAGGLGLGLALVKGIILAHGGTITVDAGRWGGARFTIRLPRTTPAEIREQDHAG